MASTLEQFLGEHYVRALARRGCIVVGDTVTPDPLPRIAANYLRALKRRLGWIDYRPQAVHFNGSSYLRSAVLSGVASGKVLISSWINSHWTPGDTTRVRACLFQADGSTNGSMAGSTCYAPSDVNPADDFWIYFRNNGAGNGKGVLVREGSDDITLNAWHHLLISANMEAVPYVIQYYMDDAPQTLSQIFQDGTTPFNIEFFRNSFWVPDWERATPVTRPNVQDMADLWIGYGQTLDLTVEANRRKFISAAGKPVFLGTNGELPTGTQPFIYFSGDSGSFKTNRGTGGAFTLFGALTDAATNPG